MWNVCLFGIKSTSPPRSCCLCEAAARGTIPVASRSWAAGDAAGWRRLPTGDGRAGWGRGWAPRVRARPCLQALGGFSPGRVLPWEPKGGPWRGSRCQTQVCEAARCFCCLGGLWVLDLHAQPCFSSCLLCRIVAVCLWPEPAVAFWRALQDCPSRAALLSPLHAAMRGPWCSPELSLPLFHPSGREVSECCSWTWLFLFPKLVSGQWVRKFTFRLLQSFLLHFAFTSSVSGCFFHDWGSAEGVCTWQ